MKMRILAILAMLCACLGTAHAQDQSEPAIFPQLGHSGGVNSVAFSPDGKLLVSGSDDNTIKLWDVASGRELRTLSGHSNEVWSVAFSPDGKALASGSDDKTIKLWDVASGRELRTLSGHTDVVRSVAFLPDGKVLASGSGDHTIKLWDVASGSELRTLSGNTQWVIRAFSRDGKVLASASEDNTIKLWDVASGRELHTLSGHTRFVESVAFSSDGKVLASGSSDHTIKLWDVASGRELRTLSGHTLAVSFVAFSPDGKVLASSGHDNTVRLWDVTSGRELRTLSGHTNKVNSVAFSPDGKMLASGSEDNTVKLWDVASGRELRTLSGHTGSVVSVAFSLDGEVLASGGMVKAIKLWDVASGRELRTLYGDTYYVTSVAFSPDGKVLASGDGDNTIKLWDVASGSELRTLSGHTGKGFVKSVAFSPDGKVLASGSSDTTVKLWDVASGRELRTLSGHANWIESIAFSPNGKALASGSQDKTIKLWDVASGRELQSLSGHTNWVSSVAFSPDGKALVSGSEDGTTREWDISSGKERVSLIAFNDGSSLAITPEGFFDSSSAQAEENLNVRVGDRVFAIGSYREKFYRPDLVKLGLAGESLTRFGSIGSVKVAPVVELVELPASASETKLTVTLRLTDGGGGIGLVRVFLNGTAVVQDEASPLPPSLGTSPIMRSYTLQLPNGPNELRAVAFNADDSMSSSSPVASIIASLPPAPRGTLHAVVVGIEEFKNPDPTNQLKYAVSDAQLFADTLKEYSAPLFQKVDIKLLTTPAETTRDSLMQTLKDMQSVVVVDDLFVFYVSSHGNIVDGEYFLVTSNVDSVDRLKAEAVSNKDLTALLANIPSSRKLVIIDTCHAQALGNALDIALLTRGMNDGTATTILSRSLGLAVLAATKSDEEAQEGYHDHGLFTYVVVDGLKGDKDADENGIVSAFPLAHYVYDQVPKLASNRFQHDQHPTVNTNGEEFSVTKVK